MHLTPKGCVAQDKWITHLFYYTKVCIKPIQNTQIFQVAPVNRWPVCRLEM
jgi:hypothetical protein